MRNSSRSSIHATYNHNPELVSGIDRRTNYHAAIETFQTTCDIECKKATVLENTEKEKGKDFNSC
jgi:hypothetical protein